MSQEQLKALLPEVLALVDSEARPNINDLTVALRDMEAIRLNIKAHGYELARRLADALPARTTLARNVGLRSKASTQADMESDWVAHWCSELKVAHVFHRKLWEFAFVLQALHEHQLLRPGMRGLGFGCGTEPLPSYLVSKGVELTATDLPPEDPRTAGWSSTNQLAASLDLLHIPRLVDRELFRRNAKLEYVDMTAIPPSLRHYDFCWSICALEHLGSILNGIDFIRNSLATLKPGGVAVHTTEFNFYSDTKTIDNWGTVLFQRKHFLELFQSLTAQGHDMAPLDFDIGNKPMDRFIDLPPYPHNWSDEMRRQWGGDANHLKLSVDGFPSTCFGIIIRKSGAER